MKYPPRNMTVEHLNWLMMVIDTDMPQQAKWIAAYLNTYMNSTQHKAWPSMGRMVQDLSLSKNTVQKHMGILIAEGWLSKKPGGVFNGKNTPNTYMLEWPERIKNSQKSEQKESPPSDLPESINCQEGVQELHYGGQELTYGGQELTPGGSGAAPKSVIESEIESEKNLNPIVATSSRPAKQQKFDDMDMQTAEHILLGVQSLDAKATANLPAWANTVRLMRERDGRTHSEIRAVFDFANQDDFWRSNIMSPAKLRKQFSTLVARQLAAAPKQRENVLAHIDTTALWDEMRQM